MLWKKKKKKANEDLVSVENTENTKIVLDTDAIEEGLIENYDIDNEEGIEDKEKFLNPFDFGVIIWISKSIR